MDFKAICEHCAKHYSHYMRETVQVCNYDNPSTYHREAWVNGVMVESVTMDVLYNKHTYKLHPWSMRIGSHEWSAGTVVGEPCALLTDDEIKELRGAK